MSRRTPGHETVLVLPDLRDSPDPTVPTALPPLAAALLAAQRTARTQPPGPRRRPVGGSASDPAGPAAADPSPAGPIRIDEVWSEYLAAPTRALRDRLVLHYTPLLRAVAARVGSVLPSYVELADLVQSGVFGLIDAVE